MIRPAAYLTGVMKAGTIPGELGGHPESADAGGRSRTLRLFREPNKEPCPECGQPMERGFIEGRYLGWATSKRGGGLRAALEGIGAELLDRRKWPVRVEAARCRKCGIGRWYENK